MLFEILENKRLFEEPSNAREYTKKEIDYAYSIIADEIKRENNSSGLDTSLDSLAKTNTLLDQPKINQINQRITNLQAKPMTKDSKIQKLEDTYAKS